jgi:hypothetical protein
MRSLGSAISIEPTDPDRVADPEDDRPELWAPGGRPPCWADRPQGAAPQAALPQAFMNSEGFRARSTMRTSPMEPGNTWSSCPP